MGLMNRFNKGTIDWGIDTKDMKYIKLSEFKEGDIVPVKGLFINNKGKFEPHPVAISENGLIDLPMHQTDTVNEILASPEVVEAIKQGKVAFKVRIYNAVKYSNKECYSVEWVDME
jgi:hypothetical protein